jgi:ABC-2 type transport system ATP-binding protein
MNAVETTGLGMRYGEAWAIRNCSLRIPPGHVVAIVGANGAGKTTLMHLAVGLLSPTQGAVRVFGLEPGGSTASLARVGYLAQEHPLYRGFTVAELFRLGRSMNPHWNQKLAEEHVAKLGIPLDRKAGKLSGGQQAQVALALVLAKRADLLVLDEPVASLDPVARREFMSALLVDSAEHGTTVLISSHVIAELAQVCDYVIVIADGAVQVDGPLEWLLSRHRTLVGPRADGSTCPPGVSRVVSRQDTDRQTTMLVELDTPMVDPRWQAYEVALDELVLGYMQQPATALRHWPEATTAAGGTR